MKVVLSMSEASKWALVNTNVKNLFIEDPTLEIAVVAFSEGVTVFEDPNIQLYSHATYYLCNNAIEVRGVDRSKLPKTVKIVNSGIYQILLLQEEGFKYVRP
ncbi:MAG: hypothetical protein ACOX5X_03720 [Acholeplasmataceae bacterium]|jgi:intracellular sulfur oxidation DsrE/DsrF family protein